MRMLGIIGGLSWHSTSLYYQTINTKVARRLGGRHSARLLIHSMDFEEIYFLQKAGKWEAIADRMTEVALQLQQGGAEGLLIASNTIHIVAEAVQRAIEIPLLHIADAVTAALQARGMKRAAVLGTGFTLNKNLYEPYLKAAQIALLKPDEAQKAVLDNLIFNSLVKGTPAKEGSRRLAGMLDHFAMRGAEVAVLACTELYDALSEQKVPLQVIDSARAHAQMGADFVLRDSGR
jgi:aspartate racemase